MAWTISSPRGCIPSGSGRARCARGRAQSAEARRPRTSRVESAWPRPGLGGGPRDSGQAAARGTLVPAGAEYRGPRRIPAWRHVATGRPRHPRPHMPSARARGRRGAARGRLPSGTRASAVAGCVDDAVRTLRWAADHARDLGANADRVTVAGDSAGGHLAALACLRLRAEGGPLPRAQALAYPNMDLTLSHPSIRAKGTGWGLECRGSRLGDRAVGATRHTAGRPDGHVRSTPRPRRPTAR